MYAIYIHLVFCFINFLLIYLFFFLENPIAPIIHCNQIRFVQIEYHVQIRFSVKGQMCTDYITCIRYFLTFAHFKEKPTF